MTTERALTKTSMEVANLTPQEVVDNATTQAKLLMNIVEQTKCYQQISGKKYLQVEAWETIGAFNRTHAETDTISPILRDAETIGYRAHVQLWKDGQIVGGAVMPCYFTESCCKGKEGDAKHKACMSAAQTFATSKAYRMNYSYVAILAGYQPLPAEEVTEDMAAPADKSKHWCIDHDTTFFMRGKMRSYAHPVGDTGEWCHEHIVTATVEPATKSTPEATESPASPDVPPEPTKATQAKGSKGEGKPSRDPATIKTKGQFQAACHEDFGLNSPAEILAALRKACPEVTFNSMMDITDYGEAYQMIAKDRK